MFNYRIALVLYGMFAHSKRNIDIIISYASDGANLLAISAITIIFGIILTQTITNSIFTRVWKC